LKAEPELIELSEIIDDFAYSISSLKGLDKYSGLKFSPVCRYRIHNINEGCIDVFLEFDNCRPGSIEVEGCLMVVDDIVRYSHTNVLLHKIEI